MSKLCLNWFESKFIFLLWEKKTLVNSFLLSFMPIDIVIVPTPNAYLLMKNIINLKWENEIMIKIPKAEKLHNRLCTFILGFMMGIATHSFLSILLLWTISITHLSKWFLNDLTVYHPMCLKGILIYQYCFL